MLFPFEMFIILRHFLNMAMSRYTSNSNTCIYQNIPKCQTVRFEVKTKLFWRFFKYKRQDIYRLNNPASKLKQVKSTTLNFKTLPVRLQKVVFKFIKTPILIKKSRHYNFGVDIIIKSEWDYIRLNNHFQSFFDGVMYLLLQMDFRNSQFHF